MGVFANIGRIVAENSDRPATTLPTVRLDGPIAWINSYLPPKSGMKLFKRKT